MVNKGRPLITGSIRQMTAIHYAALYVRSGSNSEVSLLARHVRCTLKSRHSQAAPARPSRAINRHGGPVTKQITS